MLLAGSGAFAHVFAQPFRTVKVRMQTDRTGVYAGGSSLSCASKILREEGLARGLFRGFVPGACRELLYSTCRFGLYRPLKDLALLRANPAHGGHGGHGGRGGCGDPVWAKLAAGGAAGAAGSALANPADLVMVQMQVGRGEVQVGRGEMQVGRGEMQVGREHPLMVQMQV